MMHVKYLWKDDSIPGAKDTFFTFKILTNFFLKTHPIFLFNT